VKGHTLPVLYEKYEDQVYAFVDDLLSKMQHHYRTIDARIPRVLLVGCNFFQVTIFIFQFGTTVGVYFSATAINICKQYHVLWINNFVLAYYAPSLFCHHL